MKAPMAGMIVFPMTSPTDTKGIASAMRDGRIDPQAIVALIGKSEGTGLADYRVGILPKAVCVRCWPSCAGVRARRSILTSASSCQAAATA